MKKQIGTRLKVKKMLAWAFFYSFLTGIFAFGANVASSLSQNLVQTSSQSRAYLVVVYVLALLAHLSFLLGTEPKRGENLKYLRLFSLLLPLCGYPLGYYYLVQLGLSSWIMQVILVHIALFIAQLCLRIFSQEVVLYIVFGGLTTAVSLGSFILITGLLPRQGEAWLFPKVLSFSLAILFAFWSNRRFVFQSRGSWPKEFLAFVSSRLLTSVFLELGGMWILVDLIGWQASLANLLVVVAVVVANYFWSKFFVFVKEA